MKNNKPRNHPLPIDDREMFVQVIKAGSFAAAARTTGLAVSTLNDRISRLEAQLGTVLLHRTTRRLNPTEVGFAYCDVIERSMSTLRSFEMELLEHSATEAGLIRIATTSALDMCLAPIVTAYLRQYPEMTLDLTVSPHNEDLLSDAFNLAVRIGSLPDSSSLLERVLHRTSLKLFAAPNYLKSGLTIERPEDLTGHEVAAFSGLTHLTLTNGSRSFAGVSSKIRFTANHLSSLVQQAVAGSVIALLPASLVTRELVIGSLVPILPDWYGDEVPVAAVYPRHRVMPLRVRRFIDMLVTLPFLTNETPDGASD